MSSIIDRQTKLSGDPAGPGTTLIVAHQLSRRFGGGAA